MPKHVNEKAEAAKARKEDAKKEQAAKAMKAQEDKAWQEAGEGARSKAQAKRADTEAQRAEAAAKRAEARRLAELEEAALSKPKEPKKAPKVSGYKVTAYELDKTRETETAARQAALQERELAAKRVVTEHQYASMVDTENTNRQEDTVTATGVEQAIGALASVGISSSPAPEADKHPEKRMRSAWLAFEERNLPLLKMEKPGLKQSQYREMLWTRWQRSPDNPVNKAKLAAA